MRKAPTIEALKQAAPVPAFDDFPADRCCQVWSPEMHLLDGPDGKRGYIYYSAGTGDIGSQRVHVLESAGTDPMGPYTYKGRSSAPTTGGASAHAKLRALVEQATATPKSWRLLRRLRCSTTGSRASSKPSSPSIWPAQTQDGKGSPSA